MKYKCLFNLILEHSSEQTKFAAKIPFRKNLYFGQYKITWNQHQIFFSLVKSNKKFALLFGKEKPEKCFPCRFEFYWWSVLCLKAFHVDEIPHSMYFIKTGECKSNWPWFKEPLFHSILYVSGYKIKIQDCHSWHRSYLQLDQQTSS